MKTLPQLPYLQNIVRHWHSTGNQYIGTDDYVEYLKQFGFQVPVDIMKDYLEFPDNFNDQDLTLFVLRWS